MQLCQFVLCLLLAPTACFGACDQKTCETCAANQCSWCITAGKCLDWNSKDCSLVQLVNDPFDCPSSPPHNYYYDANFAEFKALPLMAAAYSDQPQDCLSNAAALGRAQLHRQLNVPCDAAQSLTDICSAFTAVSTTNQAIIVSFRGTSNNWQLFLEGVDNIFEFKIPFVVGGSVEAYFFNAFYSLWSAGIRDDLLTLKARYPTYQLWVTGHSLGGSMASLCASLIIKLNIMPATQVKLVTFGQPRTGDLNYAKAHDKLMYYSYRVVHGNDLVPHVPPLTYDYFNNWFDSPYHHRYEVWYNNAMMPGSNFTKLCQRAEDPDCSNSVPISSYSISDHLYYFNKRIGVYGANGCTP